MKIEFDPVKSAKNARERGLPFELVDEVDWHLAITFVDRRIDYGEDRVVAVAPRHGRLYVICYVMRGDVRRVISFRKANEREERAYGRAILDRS